MAVMEMDCWKGDWGLPSVDTRCLTVMAYAKFAGAPIKIKQTNNPWWSKTGELPLYAWWIDAKNYVEFTRTWYANALPFPFRYFIPGKLHKLANQRLETSRGGPHMMEEEIESVVYKDAKECLNLLSARLSDKEFFFGDTPSSLDAYVFGHIAPLLKAPFPSSQLQNHLKGCQNLCDFCGRILHRFFPPDPEADKTESKFSADKDPFEDPHKLRNQILSVGFAIIAMVTYALLSGLVQIETVNDDNMEESESPELETYEFDEEDEENPEN
uniref:Metaxin-1-like n=1 Tax=Saccoglossus kowalevskii TaxID=10224 RepID=A0ABM0M9R2_SACKO|nr:PREDICTED: metaxin-1-like [Saccoglossus kowalevskii]